MHMFGHFFKHIEFIPKFLHGHFYKHLEFMESMREEEDDREEKGRRTMERNL